MRFFYHCRHSIATAAKRRAGVVCKRRVNRRPGAAWCNLVYNAAMSTTEKHVRQSIALRPQIAKRIRTLAKTRKTSVNRVVADLVDAGLAYREVEKRHFLALASQLANSTDPGEQQRLKEELARITFGG